MPRLLPHVLIALGSAGACQPAAAPPVHYPAGDHGDDGHGLLARASQSFVTPDEDLADDEGAATVRVGDTDSDSDGDALGFGGTGYGGVAYGGAVDGAPPAPSWGGAAAAPQMQYEAAEGLRGAIAGAITWSGALPPRLATACGPRDNLVRVDAARGVGGALVFIERVETGRPLPIYAKAATVGGVLVKRGCALLPAAQIVAPLPATLSIQGDATAAALTATAPDGVTRAIALQEGGQARLDALAGIVRVESDDRMVAPAWVIGLDTPAYAITDDAGRFRIDELAPGTYDVAIWTPPVATAGADHRLAYGAPIVVHRRVRVADGAPARLDVALH